MSARDEVLSRIRIALGEHRGSLPLDVPRSYASAGTQHGRALVDHLVERLADYQAGVHHAAGGDVAAAVAAALSAAFAGRAAEAPGRPRVVIPPGLERGWLDGTDVEVVVDDALAAADLDRCQAVVTAATIAIAETGTIVLDGSPDQGRRAITLVPDVHICVVRTDQIVGRVPEAMSRLNPTRPLTWISGPSATSDIELERVEGVHGPRTLRVVIADM